MSLPELADHAGIVIAAYIAAFLPWTLLSTLDYISPVYKTVRDTRLDGIYSLVVTFVPSIYIIFYVYLQATSADYKEMSAALVALAFSALHMARTAWGLWQTVMFRRFAATAIAALRFHDIHYSLHGMEHNADAWEIADLLLINDQVVDNQIFHGEARCFLDYAGVNLRLSKPKRVNAIARMVKLFVSRVGIAVFVFTIPFRIIFHRIVHHFNHRELPPLRMVPYEPVDMWLRWAVVFSAQGLRKWIDDFKVARDPDAYPSTNMTSAQLFQKRQAYFAAEVLASAATHISVPDVHNSSEMMLWKHWPSYSNAAHGRLTKHELLQMSKRHGKCLPFEVRHVHFEESAQLSEIGQPIDYGPYSVKLERIVEEMPVLFGSEIAQFDVEMLEWLTILIFIGTLSSSYQRRVNDCTMAKARRPSPSHPKRSDILSFDDLTISTENGKEFSVDDEAVQNLSMQLGLPRYAVSDIGSNIGILRELSAFPLPVDCFTAVSCENRLVLKVGELIDFWIALLAGDQLAFLFDLNSLWPQLLRQYRKKEVSCEGTKPSQSAARDVSHDLMDAETTERSAEGDEAMEITNMYLRELQRNLEIERLRYQFAAGGQRYWHLEQTLVFMGYGMEAVRSELARWVKGGKGSRISDWEPKFQFSGDENGRETSQVEVGRLSKELSDAILSADFPPYLQRRAVQIRLLWEVQSLLQHKMGTGTFGSSSLLTVISAIIAFPALSIDISQEVSTDCVQIELGNTEACEVSLSGSPSEGERNRRKAALLQCCVVRVRAQGSPQNMSIILRFSAPQYTEDEEYLVVTAAVCDDEAETGSEQCIFKWELWRDSFQSRLEGLSEWQRCHELRSASVHGTNTTITSGMRSIGTAFMGTGDSIIVWTGWEPFRAEFCSHELESPRFILQPEEERDAPATFFDPLTQGVTLRQMPAENRSAVVSYSESKREYLNHASMVVQETFHRSPIELQAISEHGSLSERAELTFKYAMRVLENSSRHMKRVLFLLENAAVELRSIEALSRFVELLSDNSNTSHDIDRAVRCVKRCGYELVHSNNATLLPALERQERVDLLRPIFEKLLRCNGFSPQVAIHYVSFLSWAPAKVSTDAHRGKIALRQAFLHSRDFEAITALAREEKLVNISSWNSNFESLAAKELFPGRSLNLENHSGRIENEEVNQILCKSYFERAVTEGRNANAMNNLGLLLQEGGKGVRRDLDRAASLFEAAIANGKESLGMNNLANTLMKLGDGAAVDHPRIWELYTEAAEKYGDPIAGMNVAMAYIDGKFGVPRDAQRGIERLERIIRMTGAPEVMYNLAVCLDGSRNDIPRNLKRAVELYQRSADQGHNDSMFNLATILSRGQCEIKRDVAKAKELFTRATLVTGDASAMINLGVLLRNEGGDKNAAVAKELYERAIQEGKINAMTNLANILADKNGIFYDPPRAVKLYNAALQGDPNSTAMNNLACLLRRGAVGVQKDVERAKFLFEQAIVRLRDPNAMFNLADLLLREGSPSADDEKRAVELYHLAALEYRHPNAMYNLGFAFHEGKHGLGRDAVRAKELYEMAITEGEDTDSMFNLSNLLLFGAPGIKIDVDRAIALKERAIENGHVTSLVSLALHFLLGEHGVERRPQRAMCLLEKAIREGKASFLHPARPSPEERQDVEAMWILGGRLVDGSDGIQKDTERGVSLLEEAVRIGSHPGAMCTLARHLSTGANGIEQDSERAIALFERAIREKSHVGAMYAYASLLKDGKYIQRDVDKAIDLYERAIGEGSSYWAMRDLAFLYYHGIDGVPRNRCRALELCEKAFSTSAEVSAKFEKAMVADMYAKGDEGVEKNWGRAMELLEQVVVEDNDENPMFTSVLAGRVFSGGEGVAADPCRGVELCRRAANAGDLGSCLVIGCFYEEGHAESEIPKDLTEAREWYRKAAASEGPCQGQALEALSRLDEYFDGERTNDVDHEQ